MGQKYIEVIISTRLLPILIAQVKQMSACDRFGFLSDTYALVYARYLPPEKSFIRLLNQFEDEDNPTI